MKAKRAKQEQFLNPSENGWKSEAFGERAEQQLKLLTKLLRKPAIIHPKKLDPVATENFSCPPLRPHRLTQIFRDESLLVRRSTATAADVTHDGIVGLSQALTELVKPLATAQDIRSSLKIFRIHLTEGGAQTQARFELSGRVPSGHWQINATWDSQWSAEEAESPPRLVSIEVRDYEEVVAATSNGPLFADCTEAVLGHNSSLRQQLVYGMDYWLKRIEMVHRIRVYARSGIAVGDVNGDGLADVYLCQTGGLPNRLFVQNLDGTASDLSQSAGVDWLDATNSALFVDLDNDGDQDLVAVIGARVLVMENDSMGRFQLRVALPTEDEDTQSLSAVDHDNDGDLDLFLCVDFADASPEPFVYHDANDGGGNTLFRNDISNDASGQWVFTDVTSETGLESGRHRHSLAAAWEDYDNDGDQDLYVANDYGANCLYRNDGGHFVDVADEAGVVDVGSGMSVSWGDYNRDGHMDLYVANMYSAAGNRISRQLQFNADSKTRAVYQRFAKGNTLFENDGKGKFRDVGAQAAVEMGRWAWSSPFVDLNNDGWEDLLVANGFHTTDDTGDL